MSLSGGRLVSGPSPKAERRDDCVEVYDGNKTGRRDDCVDGEQTVFDIRETRRFDLFRRINKTFQGDTYNKYNKKT